MRITFWVSLFGSVVNQPCENSLPVFNLTVTNRTVGTYNATCNPPGAGVSNYALVALAGSLFVSPTFDPRTPPGVAIYPVINARTTENCLTAGNTCLPSFYVAPCTPGETCQNTANPCGNGNTCSPTTYIDPATTDNCRLGGTYSCLLTSNPCTIGNTCQDTTNPCGAGSTCSPTTYINPNTTENCLDSGSTCAPKTYINPATTENCLGNSTSCWPDTYIDPATTDNCKLGAGYTCSPTTYINPATTENCLAQGDVCLPRHFMDPFECDSCQGSKVCLPRNFVNPSTVSATPQDTCSKPGYICSPPSTRACDTSVVHANTQAGFLEYVVTECMSGGGEGINFLGKPTLGPGACLGEWVARGANIPFGSCRVAYQNLVNSLSSVAHTDFVVKQAGAGSPCRYSASSGLFISAQCRAFLGAPLTTFHQVVGYVPPNDQCNAYYVFMLDAHAEVYSNLIKSAFANTTSPIVADAASALGIAESGTAQCLSCYESFYTSVNSGITEYPDLRTVCLDPLAPACLKSTLVGGALYEFSQCSGGLDMVFKGGVCSKSAAAEIESKISYTTLTSCALDPSGAGCSSVEKNFGDLISSSASGCVMCYRYYYKSVVSAKPKLVDACDPDVTSYACMQGLSDILSEFEACSGAALVALAPPVSPSSKTDLPVGEKSGAFGANLFKVLLVALVAVL